MIAAATLTPATIASAAGLPGPVHVTINGVDRWVSADTIVNGNEIDKRGSDVPAYQAQVVDPDGTVEAQRTPVQGTSVYALLGRLGLDPRSVTNVRVARVDAPPSVAPYFDIGRPEITDGYNGDPGAGCRGPCLATIILGYDSSAPRFFRPLRGPGDVNFYDYVRTARGTALQIAVTTDRTAPLNVSLTVDDRHPDVGAPVRFAASVAASPPSTWLSWDFGDGSQPVDGGKTEVDGVSHTYAAGLYTARVSANSDDGAVGFATVQIQVGAASGSAQASTPTASNGAAGGGSGGNGSGGGSAATGGGNGSSKAAATGTAKSSKKHTGAVVPKSSDQNPGSSSNSRRVGSGSGRSASASTRTPSASTSTATPTPAPAPAATPAPTLPPSTTPATSPGDKLTGDATTPPTTPADPGPGGGTGSPTRGAGTQLIPIRGLAVAGRGPNIAAALVAAEALAASAPAPPDAARAAAGHGLQVAGWMTGAVVIIALLGFGAAQEWRQLPRPRASS